MSSFCETRIKYSVASSNPAKIDVRISGSSLSVSSQLISHCSVLSGSSGILKGNILLGGPKFSPFFTG